MNNFEYAPFYGPKAGCQQGHCVYTTSGDVIVSSSGSEPRPSSGQQRTHIQAVTHAANMMKSISRQNHSVQQLQQNGNVVEMFADSCTSAPPPVNLNQRTQMTYYGKVPQTFTAHFPPTPPSTEPIYSLNKPNGIAKYNDVWGLKEQAQFAELWKVLSENDKKIMVGACSSVEKLVEKDITYKADLKKATACVDVIKKQAWRGYSTVTTDDLVKCGVQQPSDFPELLTAPSAGNE